MLPSRYGRWPVLTPVNIAVAQLEVVFTSALTGTGTGRQISDKWVTFGETSGLPMEYRGVEYSIVELIDGNAWRWEIKFGAGKNRSGVTPFSRAAAIKIVEYEIDRVLKDRK
jgi:hypothetical protein